MAKRGRKPFVSADGTLKVCGRCGEAKPATKEFWHRGKEGSFGFSNPCKACTASQYVVRTHPCPKCGKEVVGASRYCGPDCRFEKRPCAWCKSPFHVKYAGQLYCNDDCCRAHQKEIRRTPQVKCLGCGKDFTPKRIDRYGKFCTRECAWGHRSDAPRPDYESYPHRRRARLMQQARRGDRPTVEQVVIRDGHACHLCGLAVDLSLRAPHKMSASLDHIQPFSKGGLDVLDNVKLAHYGCNSARGNRDLTEDVRSELCERVSKAAA